MAHKFRHGDTVALIGHETPGIIVGVSDDGRVYRVAWDKRIPASIDALSDFSETVLEPRGDPVNLRRSPEIEDALEYYSVVSGFDGKG